MSPSSSEASPDAPLLTPLLTIVVPTYNEKGRIVKSFQQIAAFMAAQDYPVELLIADDGSTDGTVDLVDALRDRNPRVRTLRGDHRGKAFTVRRGMLAASGRYVLFSDADLSTPIDEVNRFLPYLQNGDDVVIGSREAPGARRFDEPVFRHLMGRVFTRAVHLITGQRFEDTQCGFKAFSREAAHAILSRVQLYGANSPVITRSRVTGFDVELLFLAGKLGYRVREVPVRWYYSPGSKVNPLRDSLQNLLDVIQVRLHDVRGHYGR